ncbi:MAG TPA: type II toxin-antitoxin system VapC family toxin [Candidatus Dormibacteraeota bacterium]
MSYLLDTNVLSELRKPRPDANVKAWFGSVSGADLHLSVLVIGEIRQGVERLRRREPARTEPYDAWLGTLQREYADRVIPITSAVAEAWGRLNSGDPISVVDGLMAATAVTHGLTLVTRNVTDVTGRGVDCLNPWDDRPPLAR